MRNRLTLLFLFMGFHAFAQLSEGGLPMSLTQSAQDALNGKMPAAKELPVLDAAQALAEDSKSPGQNRFAAPIQTDINLDNTGAWQVLPNGDRVWLCTLRSAGAKGLSILFETFKLSKGARFYAYNDQQQVFGAYTAQSCLPSGKFLIGVLKGEIAMLELYEPAAEQGQNALNIQRIDVAYDQSALSAAEDFGDGLPCNININCAEGNAWQTQKKAIARILMVFSNGQGWCSGSLIANTSNTFEPYFLTAHHCQIIGLNPVFDLWRFDFDYESANCANPVVEPTPKSVLGCERISYRSETDFMLLKLNPIPLNYEVYFNGWNRDGAPTTVAANSVFIHHPYGDIKKISIDTQACVIHPSVLNWPTPFGSSPANSHWKSITDFGVFQPGSSGSPLLDVNKHIVGQLHGGSFAMGNECKVTGAYFGRFNVSWSQGSSPETRLKEWLDPTNTGALTQNGYLRPAIQGYSISGNIKSHWGIPLEGVRVDIGGSASASVYTDSLGNFQFVNIPAAGNYNIKPVHDINDLNGVTTYDLVLISKHNLAIETLDSPWKMIAADVNQSNSITTFDIVEARKVILGINPSFATNSSWRFLPAYTTFNNPLNPFQGGVPPDNINITNLQQHYIGADFKGIKISDVNNTAIGN